MPTYQFGHDSSSSLLAIRQAPVDPKTQGLFISETEQGYGATAVAGDWTLPAVAVGSYQFFEYINGATGEYHRINVADMVIGGSTPEPPVLDVRHPAWPGTSRREMEIEVDKQRQRAVAKAIARAKANKVRLEQEAERKRQEAITRTDVEAQYGAVHGSEQDAIAQALKDAGLSDYAE